MIQLKIKNYSTEEKQILADALASALFSIPCDLDENGFCKEMNCKNYKICTDLGKASCYASKSIYNEVQK